MKTIIVSALVLMMFAGVAGTIQAIHASKSGLFNELYQPTHHVLSKKDVFHHTSNKKEFKPERKDEKVNQKMLSKNLLHPDVEMIKATTKISPVTALEETAPAELNRKISTPKINKEIKKLRKFKASMFSRGALDEEYLEEVKVDSTTIIP